MNFKQWLLSEEIFPQNNTATVYHRTKSVDSVSNMLTQGFRIGEGCLYGCGLYTTFDINSQFTDYMDTYGNYVTKWKVTGLDKYLIFQLQVAKSIHKENFSISTNGSFLKFTDTNVESFTKLIGDINSAYTKSIPTFIENPQDPKSQSSKNASDYVNECLRNLEYSETVDYGQLLKVRRQYTGRFKNNNSWMK